MASPGQTMSSVFPSQEPVAGGCRQSRMSVQGWFFCHCVLLTSATSEELLETEVAGISVHLAVLNEPFPLQFFMLLLKHFLFLVFKTFFERASSKIPLHGVKQPQNFIAASIVLVL